MAERTVEIAPSAPRSDWLNVRRRRDLENLLATLEPNKPVAAVYFYEIQSLPGTVSADPLVWIVALSRSGSDVYKFYSFLGSAEPNGPSQEFNRFTSHLALSMSEEKAAGLARLFLQSCLEGDNQEIVLDDEIELRLAVQDHYFTIYGDLWRALDAYSRWWQGFQPYVSTLEPTVLVNPAGGYRVLLSRLVAPAGKHPEVQSWQLEISRGGEIRVLAKQLVFPDQPGLVFYDLDSWPPFPPFGH